MIIKGEKVYIKQLSCLWKNVFGDDDEFINLFFDDVYPTAECFAYFEDNKIVSVLYLLSGEITANGKTYKGRYLYAAATDEAFRKRGLMALLINEALQFAKDECLDFISLLPASESLYGYYAKFGYKTKMYKYRQLLTCKQKHDRNDFDLADNLQEKRKLLGVNKFNFTNSITNYAHKAMKFYGYDLYSLKNKNDVDAFAFANEDFTEIYECICKNEDYNKALLCLEDITTSDTVVYSPYASKNCTKVKNGMMLALNKELENIEIYMNFALE